MRRALNTAKELEEKAYGMLGPFTEKEAAELLAQCTARLRELEELTSEGEHILCSMGLLAVARLDYLRLKKGDYRSSKISS